MDAEMSPQTDPGIADLSRRLIDGLRDRRLLKTASVEAAFRAVPRHVFLPNVPVETAYSDEAIPTKFRNEVAISSSSQPAMMAIMLEQLQVQPGHRVLEIGAGTGYNAALLARIVGDAGSVVTVDIDDDIVGAARAHLAAAGFGWVRVVRGDGALGHPDAAPYDRIILTVRASEIAPAWFDQLSPSGRLVLPLSLRGPQASVAFARVGDRLESVSMEGCGFMPLRGAMAGPATSVEIEPGLSLTAYDRLPTDVAIVQSWMARGGRDHPTGIRTTRARLQALDLWLSLREPDLCRLVLSGEVVNRDGAPCLIEYVSGVRNCSTVGVIGENGLSVLSFPASSPGGPDAPAELYARSYGPDDSLARRLIGRVTAWDASGGNGIHGLRVYKHRDSDLGPDETPVPGRSYRLVVSG